MGGFRGGIGIAVIGMVAIFAQPTWAATKCNVKSIQAAAPKDTTIVSAQKLDKPVPHCKVDGYVTTNNPGPNRANFRVQLPDKSLWKGRYYFIGLGGSAGYVPTDSQIPPGNPLVKGFVVAGTDTGRQGHLLDWDFLTDPAKRVDHIHRAGHVTTVAAQQITKAYYGADKIYRYHSGCSGGGRMGQEAIQKHPEDYDGVLLGASGGRSYGTHNATILKFIHATQQMTREPGSWVSPAKLKMVEEKVTAACDMSDGAKDDVIWDHRLCKFDMAKLKCKKGDAPDCLTKPELKSIENILDGPRGSKGELLSQPMPISNIGSWTFLGAVPPPWSPEASAANMPKTSGAYVIANTVVRVYFGPDFDLLKDFNLKDQKRLDEWEKRAEEIGIGTRFDSNLQPLEKAGGKVLMWGGVSDSCCSNIDLQYYIRDVTKALDNDGARVAKFMQLYEFPGMAHCGGGTGAQDAPDQLLQTLIDWVEQGKTPGPVVVHRGADRVKMVFTNPNAPTESGVRIPAPTGASRDFLVCPFPQVSVFDKSKANEPGAVNEAANWSCRASRS